jgi:Na+/H+-dicarboxylate symporter
MSESKGLPRSWKIALGTLMSAIVVFICISPELNDVAPKKDIAPWLNAFLRVLMIGATLVAFALFGRNKKMALHWKIIFGLVIGVIFAYVSSEMGWSAFTLDWIKPWGTIFINILKMIAVPMVLFSIIMGVVSLGDGSKLGRMGLKTLGMYLATTLFAVMLGLIIVNVMDPGGKMDLDQRVENRVRYEYWALSTDGVEILDSKNYRDSVPFQEIAERVRSTMSNPAALDSKLQDKIAKLGAQKSKGPLQFVVDIVPSNIFKSLTDNGGMLQIIFFAILFGVTMLFIPKDKAQPVINVVSGLNEIFIKMIGIIMQAAPFLVFALLAGTVSDMAGDNPAAVNEIFLGLGWYSITVIIGLGLMIFLVYPLITQWLAKIPYRRFFKAIGGAQTMAFSTSSSVATLPVTVKCVEENLGVSKETSSFVLPIGATVNMDGTSLYQAVAVLFMAQMHIIDLDIMQQLTIVFTATLASIGAAAVPSAGLILMMVVLESVGLNPFWIAIIFPVDRILDMCRTVVNVTGDATVSSVIAKSEGQLNLPEEKLNVPVE